MFSGRQLLQRNVQGYSRNLDYIAGLGVNAIWISPFTLNTNDSSGDIDYFGRWPLDIYQINPSFGTRQDLIDLVNACHSRDIWVMADLVIRNMGYQDGCRINFCPSTNNFEKFTPFDKLEHYDARSTWLNNLPKLNHTNNFVRTTLINWVRDLSEEFSFDGFRLDNVDGISEEFLEELNNSTQIFMIGQTSTSGRELAEYQRVLDSVFDRNVYFNLNTFFGGSGGSKGYYHIPDSLSLRRDWFADGAVLGGYLDNHDVSRSSTGIVVIIPDSGMP
ncbi:uncharacterized protein [Ptychodera flava]|uniref:uncharacterized protein n=1 Tax=Ptychodera flava TaxID=63121 RepID=UPI003969E1F2